MLLCQTLTSLSGLIDYLAESSFMIMLCALKSLSIYDRD
jgi:hypothetical protein